jgi:arylsulfatase A-like enzyme
LIIPARAKKLDRMRWTQWIVVACVLVGGWRSAAPAAAGGPRMNVVLIVADDLGWRDLSCFGSTFYETPNLDRLAARGVKLTSAYAAPVCSPTRGSFLTGKYPVRHGVTDFIRYRREPGAYSMTQQGFVTPVMEDRLPLKEVTIAEALKEKGYATFFAGKWHLGPKGAWPEDQGFDLNKGGYAGGHPAGKGGYFPPYGNPNLSDGPKGEHLDERLAAETISFIEKQQAEKSDQPFFVEFALYSPHTPLMAREELIEKYRKKAEKLGITESKFGMEGKVKVRQNQNQAVYAAMLETMDGAVGRVIEAIDRLKLSENTVIIFVSDNGGLSTAEGSPTSNVPLRGGKGWVYEGGVRVPAIVVAPGVTRAGTTSDAMVSSTDWYPTILELAGLPPRPEQHVDGVSVTKALRGEKFERGPIYWHYPHFANQKGFAGGAVREGDFKLVQNYTDGKVELFNLKEDIGETKDLASEQVEKRNELLGKLKAWQKGVGAQFPRKVEGE